MKRLNIITILIVLFSLSVISGFARNDKTATKGNKKSIKSVGAGCLPPTSSTYLEFNNVKAMIHNGGDMWWDFTQAQYKVPKDGNVSALFAGSIWVGGTDTNGQLRFAGHRFRSNGVDFYPGPLIKSGENQGNVPGNICTRYDRQYYITRNMVTEFIGYASSENPTEDFPDYTVPEVISSWPAHGPTEDEYDYYLAPFKDVNGDGAYTPSAGDYPYYIFNSANYDCNSVPENVADSLDNEDMQLFGDATLWWVYNDRGNVHGESQGEAIGMEFRAQAFAFATNDELNNMTFYNYQIINRSTYTLKEAFFGVWTDGDLGYSDDDYTGCDVKRGLGYIYNGDPDDDADANPPGYGLFPPAIGIDFFEGPYKDVTNNDDLSSYDPDGNIVCDKGYRDYNGDGIMDSVESNESVFDNGNINGLNFGDGIADNERWGMRRFLYFTRGGGDYGDPDIAQDYYRYLRGFWKNGKPMTHGGSGHDDGPLRADFMFPGETDNDCFWGTGGNTPVDEDWTQAGADGTPADQRFVQSAGPFTLEPGNVNDITTGAVWARAYENDPFASVKSVQKADDKAQTLFEQCFQLIDGPDAPELTIIEMDQKFIFHISNPVESNNYLEQYEQEDPFLVNYADNTYKFQGYQVYQLIEPSVSLENLRDNNFSKLVFQCDVKDDVENLVNWDFNSDIDGHIPEVMVEANNDGIRHTFEITKDQFATGTSNLLVNNKKYYFIAVAYAYNEFAPYIQTDSTALNGQKTPYLGSRKSVSGQIKVHEVIPHPTIMQNGGTELFASYGDQPSVTKVEGEGNGRQYLMLADGLEDSIMTYYNNDVSIEVTYKANHGPLNVKVVDPFNVKAGTYYVGVDKDIINPDIFLQNIFDSVNAQPLWGYIADGKWFIAKENALGGLDTIAISPDFISNKNEVVFEDLGISIEMEQFQFPLKNPGAGFEHLANTSISNGYIGSSMEFENPDEPWLDFIEDEEGQTYTNWIRAGTSTYDASPEWNDIPEWVDPDQLFEGILFGKWAPYRLASYQKHGPSRAKVAAGTWPTSSYGVTIPSVNIVITKDRSKWTRVPVFETTDNTLADTGGIINPLSEGGALKFELRKSPSLDKDGNPSTTTDASQNINDPNFVSGEGWSWFPGYAVDVDNGRRLMMAFGESSWLVGYNGRDMLWNPVETIFSEDDNVVFGGKHFIYVFAAEANLKDNTYMLPYSETDQTRGVWYLNQKLEENLIKYVNFIAWTAIPYTRTGYQFNTYDEMPDNDLRIELRIAKPLVVGKDVLAVDNPINDNYPMYKFTLDNLVPQINRADVAEDALKDVNVVPNPYYGGNNYESAPLEYIVKITNLPQRASIKIFNMAGTLVKSFEKDNSSTIVEWDLKNNYQVPIAGGMYIIHIQVPGVGEKTLKWFGILRPDDLSSF